MSHLTLSNRIKLEHGLKEGHSLQEIADLLGKARSTILREVKKHRVESLKPGYHRIPNRCIDRRQCQLHHVCPKARCYQRRRCAFSSPEKLNIRDTTEVYCLFCQTKCTIHPEKLMLCD